MFPYFSLFTQDATVEGQTLGEILSSFSTNIICFQAFLTMPPHTEHALGHLLNTVTVLSSTDELF